jgi:hypothetical protein
MQIGSVRLYEPVEIGSAILRRFGQANLLDRVADIRRP